MSNTAVARGKPAEFGDLILKRRARLTRALVDFEGKQVLDFGCGNGAQTMEFQDSGARLVALDIHAGNIRTLKSHLESEDNDSIDARSYDGSRIPLEDASVDLVLSYEVLEHVQDEAQTLQEIRRVLKPGGELVFSLPNKWWVFETHGANLPLLPWNRVPFFSWLPKPIHQRFAKARIYRKGSIRKLFREHGFRIHSIRYITAPMDMVGIDWLQRWLRHTIFQGDETRIPFLATSILVHAGMPKPTGGPQ